ncbi:hypothetical protein PIB30_085297, partial [Stylosanthes scabra]|nr:hypothetical protein [Stylosanthes scabra]
VFIILYWFVLITMIGNFHLLSLPLRFIAAASALAESKSNGSSVRSSKLIKSAVQVFPEPELDPDHAAQNSYFKSFGEKVENVLQRVEFLQHFKGMFKFKVEEENDFGKIEEACSKVSLIL